MGENRPVGGGGSASVGGEDWPSQGCGWEEEGLVGGGSFLRQCFQLCQEKGWIYIYALVIVPWVAITSKAPPMVYYAYCSTCHETSGVISILHRNIM